MVTYIDLGTGEVGGATCDTGYVAIEDLLDGLHKKYIRLIGTKRHFMTGGKIAVDWDYIHGDLTINSINAEYNGDGAEVSYANSILRHWIFCKAIDISKVVGVISVKQRDV